MLSLSSEAGRGSYNDLPESEKVPASARFQLIKTSTVFLKTIRSLSMEQQILPWIHAIFYLYFI